MILVDLDEEKSHVSASSERLLFYLSAVAVLCLSLGTFIASLRRRSSLKSFTAPSGLHFCGLLNPKNNVMAFRLRLFV